jgi:hypothetical protein
VQKKLVTVNFTLEKSSKAKATQHKCINHNSKQKKAKNKLKFCNTKYTKQRCNRRTKKMERGREGENTTTTTRTTTTTGGQLTAGSSSQPNLKTLAPALPLLPIYVISCARVLGSVLFLGRIKKQI